MMNLLISKEFNAIQIVISFIYIYQHCCPVKVPDDYYKV